MIEANTYFPSSTCFLAREINNETVWRYARYEKVMWKTAKAYMIEIDDEDDLETYNNLYKYIQNIFAN